MTATVILSTCQSVWRDQINLLRHDPRMAEKKPRYLVDRLQAIERLERVRLAHNLPKGRFAQTLGMYASNYSRVLKGEFFLTSDQLFTVWQLYGADPRYIMTGLETGLAPELLERIRAQAGTR